MKEHPILFSAPMILAILDGKKTQTRRAFKDKANWHFIEGKGDISICPYGQVGDRLWARETFGVVSHAFDDNGGIIDWNPDRHAVAIHEMPFGNGYYSGHVIYRADGEFSWCDDDGAFDEKSCWKPSIHMPRVASRITLEIIDIRVERLNEISEQDALSEGVVIDTSPCDHIRRSCDDIGCAGQTAKGMFKWLWKLIYGKDSWQQNPWVWVVEFKRIQS